MTNFIAHRGFGKENKQNTTAAFRCASQSVVYGVETDVRTTNDNVFVVFHDKSTTRLCGKYKIIEKTDFKKVQELKVLDRHLQHTIPTFLDFLQNCKSNKKVSVVEIKSNLTKEQIEKFIQIIDKEQYLTKTIFISFNKQVLKYIRELLPEQPIQILAIKYKNLDLKFLQEYKFGIDIHHLQLTKERITECHELGIDVNCWTVNSIRRSKLLQQWGVDFITTDKIIISENNIS